MSNQACSSGKQKNKKIPKNGSISNRNIRNLNPEKKGNNAVRLQNTAKEVNLTSPGLCAALRIVSEIKTVTEKEKNAYLFNNKNSQENSNKKVNNKVNIPFSEHIFTNLVDLNIDNEVIPPGKIPVKVLNSTKRDNDFDLSKFYKSDFSTQCLIEYSYSSQAIEKLEHYNGLDIYERLEALPVYYNF